MLPILKVWAMLHSMAHHQVTVLWPETPRCQYLATDAKSRNQTTFLILPLKEAMYFLPWYIRLIWRHTLPDIWLRSWQAVLYLILDRYEGIFCLISDSYDSILYLISDWYDSPTDLFPNHELFTKHGQDKVFPAARCQAFLETDDPFSTSLVGIILSQMITPTITGFSVC